MTTAEAGHHWRARPWLAAGVRVVLLAVPLLASSAAVYALARWLPPGAARSAWGLAALLALGLLVALAVERGTRRLLPIALLLRLATVFPDRAPSRLRLARAAAGRPRHELLWTGPGLQPTSTSDLVLALVGALGAHDRRTRGHSERVRLLCDVLAVELGLGERERDRLRWAALLHDVGKVEVAARILNKPSALSDEEFDQVRLHPAAGAALAAPLLPWLGTWGEGILDHHERYDGSGYPHGKSGEQISAAGRLIAVIDAFETMTAARPYKQALATRAAREELARCAGTHFDPAYVRAFLAIPLPRLLWAMGPLSFLLQLPFLTSIAQSGVRAGAAVPQAAGAVAAGAAGAAGAAVLATGAVTGAGTGAAPPTVAEALAPPPAASAQPAAGSTPAATAPGAAAAPSPAPAARPSAAAVRPVAPAAQPPSPAPAAARPPGTAGPTPAAAAPGGAASADPRADETHPAIKSGPPPTTTSRTATFELVPGDWECQLVGAADGSPSRWEPCAGTFSVTVVRDGEQVLRVREAQSRDEVDAWEWTVTSAGPAPQAGPALEAPAVTQGRRRPPTAP